MNIQAKIRQKGFTVAQVASKMKKRNGEVGISQGSLSTILNRNPTIDKLKEIAEILNISLSELVADENELYPTATCPHCGKSLTIKTIIE